MLLLISLVKDFLVGIGKTAWLRNYKNRKPTSLTPFLASLRWFDKERGTSRENHFIWKSVLDESSLSLSCSFVVDVRATATSGREAHLEGKEGKEIRFSRPENEDVTELLFRGTLHVDGIPLCESSNRLSTVDIISLTIHNTNPVNQQDRAFIITLAIVPKEDNIPTETCPVDLALKEVQFSTTVMGKLGFYFKKFGHWYHIRWYLEGLLADYKALTQTAGRGSPGANCPCLICPIRRAYYNPLFHSFVNLDFPSFYKIDRVKTLGMSSLFLHPSSLYRLSSAAYHSIQNCISLIDKIPGEKDDLWKEEYRQMRSDFSYLSPAFTLMWTPNCLSPKSSDDYVRHCVAEYCNENGVTENERLKIDKCFPNQVTQSSFSSDDLQRRNTLLPSGGYYILDSMHLYSNVFFRFACVLDNCVTGMSKMASKWYTSFFHQLFPHMSFATIPTRIPFFINGYAVNQLDKLNHPNHPWITKSVLVPSIMKTLTCEQRIKLYMNLFTYMYVNSLSHPVIHYMNKIIHIMAYLYNVDRDYKNCLFMQWKLSYYLHQLEANLPPSFSCSVTHLLNHLDTILLFAGPIRYFTNFNSERQYKHPKKFHTDSRYVIDSLSVHEIAYTMCSILLFGKREPISVTFGAPTEWPFDGNLEEVATSNLVDDCVFSMNSTLPHQTYLDYLLTGEDVEIWKKNYKHIREYIPSVSCDGRVYKTLRWNGKEYLSTQEPASSITQQWIISNPKVIAYCRGYGDCVYYFIIRGYVIASVGGVKYPLALCTPIKTRSIMEDFYSFCTVEIDPDWRDCLGECYCISLYRLYIGQAIAYKFTSDVFGLSPMALHIDQFKEICGDSLFYDLRKQIIDSQRLFKYF